MVHISTLMESVPYQLSGDPVVACDAASESSPPSCDISDVAQDAALDRPLGD